MSNAKQKPIQIDLDRFKLHLSLKEGCELSLHFDTPSRRFYLCVIAFVVNEMKKLGRMTSIPLGEHWEVLALLNETVAAGAGSSSKENLLSRIYRKWKDGLPDLETAPLFKVLGKRKEYGDGGGKAYLFTDEEKDGWANLFEYKGSFENVRLRFSADRLGATLNDVGITYGESTGLSSADGAWERFVNDLENVKENGSQGIIPPGVPIEVSTSEPRRPPGEGKWWAQWQFVMTGMIIVAILAGSTLWVHFGPDTETASKEKMAFALPDVPSIAVLPFANMSGDPKQDFLSDGITENIITALSKVPKLFVIARNSTFVYKEKPVKVKQVSEELGIRYVLEGSVQRSSDRIRVAAQLIDAINGQNIWAERYDREIEDIFALQDEITMKILSATQVKLMGLGTVHASHVEKWFKGKHGLDCYLKYLEANAINQRATIEAMKEVRRIGEEVTSLCPESPGGLYLLAMAHASEYWRGTSKSPRESLDKGIELMQKSLAIDDSNGQAHGLLGMLYTTKREYDKGIAEGERAVALNPGGAPCLFYYAFSLTFGGRYEEAIPLFQKAVRVDPAGTHSFYYQLLGHAFLFSGRFAEAVSAYKTVIKRAPDYERAHMMLAAAYSMMGRKEEARAEIAEVRRINPKFSLDDFRKKSVVKDRSKRDDIANALSKAGLK
jgi:TolB-like protein/Tfp pilus assembly protein PilF